MKHATVVVGILAALLGFTWLLQGNDFFLYQVFAPKYEQVRREVFEQSKAYNQGMIQELENMRFEYARARADQRAALASVILHRAADYNLDEPRVPADLRRFIQQLRAEAATAR